MNLSLRKKITLLVPALPAVVSLVSLTLSSIEIERYYKAQVFEQLFIKAAEVDHLLHTAPTSAADERFLRDYAAVSRLRLTLIDSSGVVLFDTSVPSDSLSLLSNHLDRPEIIEALKTGVGRSERRSGSVHRTFFYAARRVNPPASLPTLRLIRIAQPAEQVHAVLAAFRRKNAAATTAALLLIAFIGYVIAGRLTRPIRHLSETAAGIKQGDRKLRFEAVRDDELGELAALLNQMLDKMQEDMERLKELERMRSRFLGNVSHELRTPIFSIQGYLETLLHNPSMDAEKRSEFVGKAYRQTARLNTLLTDLIDISRIESGEMKMVFRPFKVDEWLRQTTLELEETASEHGVRLEYVGGGADLLVLGDRERLNQVIYNLVINAVKYNYPGGRVQVGFIEHRSRVEIYVADTGRGIPEEHLPRIFERFYRVDKERSRQLGGTGLGLAIVKHIVEAHGGSVTVESRPGRGSRFAFFLKKASKKEAAP